MQQLNNTFAFNLGYELDYVKYLVDAEELLFDQWSGRLATRNIDVPLYRL